MIFTSLCVWLGQEDVSLANWMRFPAHSAVDQVPAVAAARPSTPRVTGSVRLGQVVPRPAAPRAAVALRPVLQRPTTLPIHGGGSVRTAGISSGIGLQVRDEFAEDLGAAPVVHLADELQSPQARSRARPLPERRVTEPAPELPTEPAPEFQEDLRLAPSFDPSPVKMKGLDLLGARAPSKPAHAEPSRAAEPREPVRAVRVSSGGSGVAHVGGGCQRAFESAERRIDMAGATEKDVSRESYARQLENFSNFAACQVPARATLKICVAVQSGRALGVTVTTKPASRASDCVARIVQGFSFPSSANPDLVRTEFRSQ